MEHKVCDLSQIEIKAGDSGNGRIAGYAATFGNKDRQGDIITPGAFVDGIPRFLQDGFIALGHDHSALPVAIPVAAKEDAHGLWIEADFHSTPEAQRARTVAQERIAAGKSVAFSIGYVVADGGTEYSQDARLLKKLDTYEVSLVNIPANPLALVAGVKDGSLAGLSVADHFDAVLAAADEFVTRVKGIQDLREKEGRVLSGSNMNRMQQMRDMAQSLCDTLDQMMADAMPKTQDTPGDMMNMPKGTPAIVAAQKLRDMQLRLAQFGVH